jgi:O-antigen/teichoic acid export membrane protein
MRFDLYSGIDLAGSVIQSVSAVIFALIKPSVWCLVWAYLVKQVVVTSLSWYFSGYRVKFFFDRKIAEELFHYGKFMVGLTVLWYLAENVNNIVVGRVLGATMVGYFALAANIGNFINTHFTYLLSGVMFPAYSAIQHDMDAVRRAYFKTTKYVSMVSIPFAVALVCLAEEFVLTLYGEQWLPIVPVIRVFGFIQFFFPVLACSSSLFLGCGKPQFNFYLTFFPLLIRIPLLFVLTKMFGLIGTVSAVAVTHVLFTPVNAVLVRRILGFQWKEFLPQFLPSLYCAFVMFLAIQILKASVRFPEFSLHHAAVLLFLGIAGALAYLAALFIIDRRATLEVTRMVLKMERA